MQRLVLKDEMYGISAGRKRDLFGKRVIGTSDQYPDVEAARAAVAGLIAEVNWSNIRADSIAMTVAQLSRHFEKRELARSNTWRSYPTKKCYSAY